MAHDVQAVSMSWRVGRQLREPGWTGEIFSVQNRGCYVVGDRSEIIAILQQPAGNHPLALLLPDGDGFFSELSAGVSVASTGERLGIGDALTIGLDRAALWDPKAYPGVAGDGTALSHSVPETYRVVEAFAPERSLARLLPHLQEEELPEDLKRIDHFERGHALIGGLVDHLSQRNPRPLKTVTTQLAGFGPGVVPAGDEFLCGSLIALALAHEHRPDAVLATIAGLIVETATPRTNEISVASLRAAYAGEVAESWHPLIRAVAEGHVGDIEAAARAVMDSGEVAGPDMLAGFLASLTSIYRMSPPEWRPATLSPIGSQPADPPAGEAHG